MALRTFTLTVTGPDTTAPTQPGSFTATAASSTQINLSWTASTDPAGSFQVVSGVAGYRVYRDGGPTPIATVTSGTTFNDTGRTASTTYNYTVVAYDVAGNTSTAASASAQTLASGGTDPVIQSRLPYGGTWAGLVGVIGGIPARTTQYGATIAAGASAATINAAIAACPAESHVLLGPGDFYLTGSLNIRKSNVTLRGSVDSSGRPTTIVHGSSIQLVSTDAANSSWDVTDAGKYTTVNVASGLTRGSTTITLTGTPTGLTTGRLLIISAPKAAPTVDGGGGINWLGNPFTQIVKVTNVSGTTVTFTPPINADYLSGTCKVSYRGSTYQISRSGVENISLRDGTGRHVNMQGADECWVKNCITYSVGSGTVHIYPYVTFRTEIRHCDISHMTDLTNSTYCIQPIHGSNLLIIDNYFHDCPNVMPTTPMSGSAFAYNYVNDLPYSPAGWLSQIVFAHGCHSHYNLFEGNWCAASYNDFSSSGEQSHSRNTLWLRNRMRGWDATGPKSSNCQAFTTETHHDNITLAGNVLGENGFHTVYSGTSGNHVLEFDATSAATVDLIANYNTVNDAVPAAEALGGGQTLPQSYLFASKPSWFGSLPWPWCDPTNYSQSNTYTNLPAGYRAANAGVDPP